ncbi:ABC transporter permease [Cellulomonas sp. GbtcB1]|jgi:NitT/TauT family transport system permease protein|uniref:ABC transporter permease n=1 Tax=Cellulomonas sp. GbtcB1 TaxID=2824746 RepID=UPI001C30ABDD|nr:ABC transporter permease subunit [Cellulomonas sp. GbtcB1]
MTTGVAGPGVAEAGDAAVVAPSAAALAPAARRTRTLPAPLRALRPVALGLAALVLLAALWELVKAVVPEDGWSVGELRVLPRTTDLAMPHVTEMLARLGEPLTSQPGADPLWLAVLRAGGASLRIAAVSWVLGVVVGFALALLMTRFRVARSAVLPLVVLSQTVPLIALAPLVKGWGSKLELGFTWEPWMSVAVIASYLAFFPVAVGALRGLTSPDTLHRELFAGYAASWSQELVRLRLPASVPHLLPALRLAATSAVLGVVVAEVSTGMPGGIGRMILEFANFASSDPAKPWAPIFGAVLLGLVASGAVALLGTALRRFRRAEAAA